ncbi:MAG TPA: M48 family metalloprotease [Capsulimonadaceae bacterium]|jgi:predicted Zn-dependent protease
MSDMIKHYWRTTTASAIGMALLFCVTGCRPPSFGNEVSTTQEMQIGQNAAAQVESQYQVVTDPAQVVGIQEITSKLFPLAAKVRGNITYKIKVLQTDQVNAFSLPGGWIYVTSGMLAKLGNDRDALAFVVAHEVSHVALKHATKQLSDAYGKETLVDLLTQGKYQEAANIALQLDLLSHSREDEYQADRFGVKLAREAGYNLSGTDRLFALMQKTTPGQAPPEWVQTHPINSARTKHVEQDIKDLASGKY